MRVVLDSNLQMPLESNLAQTTKEVGVLVCTLGQTIAENSDKVNSLRELGCEVVAMPQRDGLVDLEAMLAELGGRGVTELLVEGGATVLKSFWDSSLADRVMVYIAPVVIGSGQDLPSIDFTTHIDYLTAVRVRHFAGDVLIEGHLPVREIAGGNGDSVGG